MLSIGCRSNWHWTDESGGGQDGAVDMSDVLRAARVLAPHLPPTPMWTYPALDALAGATVYVKHENVQPIGAFKVRGDFLLVTDAEIARAQAVLASHAHTLAEGAGAAGLAAVLAAPERFAGRRIGLVCTGGNASAAEIAALANP